MLILTPEDLEVVDSRLDDLTNNTVKLRLELDELKREYAKLYIQVAVLLANNKDKKKVKKK